MPGFPELIAKFGLLRVIGYGLALVAILYLTAWPRITSWWHENKADRLEQQRDQARGVARIKTREAEQTGRSSTIASNTTAAQDAAAIKIQADTGRATEVIRERIREVPVVVPVPDDPVVRLAAEQAFARAVAAQDRLQGKASD